MPRVQQFLPCNLKSKQCPRERKLKGTERDDLLPEGSTVESVKKNQDNEALSPCQTEYTEQSNKPNTGDKEVLEPNSGMQGEKRLATKMGKTAHLKVHQKCPVGFVKGLAWRTFQWE